MKKNLPIMLLKSVLILPNQEVKLELNNDLSKNTTYYSSDNYHNEVVIVSPKDQMEEMPEVSDLPSVSVVCKIKSKIELPNGNLRVTLRGLFRAHIKNFKNTKNDILICTYEKLEIPEFKEIEAMAVKKKLKSMITSYVKKDNSVSNSILNVIKDVEDLNKLTDLITAFLPIPFLKKLEYIEEMNPVLRGKKLIEELNLEIKIQELESELDDKFQINLEINQKEFILKEKLKVIKEELGETNAKDIELNDYQNKLNNTIFPSKVRKKLEEELKKFAYTSDNSPEIANIRNYLDWMFNIPWYNSSIDEKSLRNIMKNLNQTHYGMLSIKDKIIEYIAAKNRNKDIKTPILCLVGPAGVGKSTLAKSIATSLNKEFYKISVGGLNDSSVLNGHRRTYLGASPGKIIEALKKCSTNNPVILIDEVDKMVKDYKGDPISVLLDILDENQNKSFVDHYIEEEIDLSNILFILTANNILNIPPELIDRLEIINLTSYTVLEKFEIAKKYLLPIIYEEHLISNKNVKFSDDILKHIILSYTKEAGVRELKRVLTRIIRKLIVLNKLNNIKITEELLNTLLKEEKYFNKTSNDTPNKGEVNAIAITDLGGKIIKLETTTYDGNGNIKITGNIEKVMKESVSVALSYLYTNKDYFNISSNYFKKKDLHIHFLEASLKKDGSSAGISITTSLLSLFKNKIISSKYAMTGEITLNGNIKKIGGLKEKLIACLYDNIKVVFIPIENHDELELIDSDIKLLLKIIEVSNYKEIYEYLFKEGETKNA